MNTIVEYFESRYRALFNELTLTQIYQEIAAVLFCYIAAYFLARYLKRPINAFHKNSNTTLHSLHQLISGIGKLLFPFIAIIFLKMSLSFIGQTSSATPIITLAFIMANVMIYMAFVELVISHLLIRKLFLVAGIPILIFHLTGVLDGVINVLDSISIELGNIRISAYGASKVLIFGSLLFWLGRLSNATGKKVIRNQPSLDFRTKEVFSKLLEIVIFFVIFLLLLQVMGINLTTLAVFGGAIGVGLGFGLQSIASNFISGLIILLDRSVSIDDYIEMEDGKTGRVTEMSLRSTTLETFDGKDIVVPNEKFITSSFINWTHKDKRQRYRVDFSVAYDSDVRQLVEIMKSVVAQHPQVIDGEDIPIEDRPDCEIDSFGDSGINMFVEFWMEGIDDGKNRVGGDLLLMILEAIRAHGFEIPFPQREVRILQK